MFLVLDEFQEPECHRQALSLGPLCCSFPFKSPLAKAML